MKISFQSPIRITTTGYTLYKQKDRRKFQDKYRNESHKN